MSFIDHVIISLIMYLWCLSCKTLSPDLTSSCANDAYVRGDMLQLAPSRLT
jgi:hypothetical protein